MMKQLAMTTMLVVIGCGGCGADPNEATDAKSKDPHLLQPQADALQRAKNSAKSLEAAGNRTESEVKKSGQD